jgi:hypothetical protein
MKNFLIYLLLLISLNINCQNIKFIYQLEQKFNIENNQLIADSLCLFNMAKDAKIDEIKIKKDESNRFYIPINLLNKYEFRALQSLIFHLSYRIEGEYKGKQNALELNYINDKSNYSKEMYNFIRKVISGHSFTDKFYFNQNKIERTTKISSTYRDLNEVVDVKLTSHYDNHYVYLVSKMKEKYIINCDADLNNKINPDFFSHQIIGGIKSISGIYYNLILKE